MQRTRGVSSGPRETGGSEQIHSGGKASNIQLRKCGAQFQAIAPGAVGKISGGKAGGWRRPLPQTGVSRRQSKAPPSRPRLTRRQPGAAAGVRIWERKPPAELGTDGRARTTLRSCRSAASKLRDRKTAPSLPRSVRPPLRSPQPRGENASSLLQPSPDL